MTKNKLIRIYCWRINNDNEEHILWFVHPTKIQQFEHSTYSAYSFSCVQIKLSLNYASSRFSVFSSLFCYTILEQVEVKPYTAEQYHPFPSVPIWLKRHKYGNHQPTIPHYVQSICFSRADDMLVYFIKHGCQCQMNLVLLMLLLIWIMPIYDGYLNGWYPISFYNQSTSFYIIFVAVFICLFYLFMPQRYRIDCKTVTIMLNVHIIEKSRLIFLFAWIIIKTRDVIFFF